MLHEKKRKKKVVLFWKKAVRYKFKVV